MVGLILFGWPKRSKVVGAATPGYCDHCQNQTIWHLTKLRRWITVFFIPVLPISPKEYWLVCDICDGGVELQEGEVGKAKAMVENTQRFHQRELSQEAYFDAVDEFTETLRPPQEAQEGELPDHSEEIKGFQ